jgi:hypothetical protein
MTRGSTTITATASSRWIRPPSVYDVVRPRSHSPRQRAWPGRRA